MEVLIMTKVNVLELASYISNRYAQENNEHIDEVKLHKLLYFSQREALIQEDMPLFDDVFQAFKFGPVIPIVRTAYKDESLADIQEANLTDEQLRIMNYVFSQYSQKDSRSLVRLTHGEQSWKNARAGISEFEDCKNEMLMEDIKEDADRQKNRRKALRELGLLE